MRKFYAPVGIFAINRVLAWLDKNTVGNDAVLVGVREKLVAAREALKVVKTV